MDDFDEQMGSWGLAMPAPQPAVFAVWTGAAESPSPSPPPAIVRASSSSLVLPPRMVLRSSSSSAPASASSSMTSFPSPLSTTLSMSPMRANSPITADMLAPAQRLPADKSHSVCCDDYARDPLLAPPTERLAGVEPLLAMLDAAVGMTLANPTLCPSDLPVMAVQSASGSGTRLAVHLWAARRAPQRVAVVTYAFFEPMSEQTVAFHHALFDYAASLSPCILIADRIMDRAVEQRTVEATYNAMAYAWTQRREHRPLLPGTLPPFWLLFIDSLSPNVVPPHMWSIVPHNAVLEAFGPANAGLYVRCVLHNHVAARLASGIDVDTLMAQYEPHLALFLASHGSRFTAIADVVRFAKILFALPLRSHSVADLHSMAVDGAPPSAWPTPEHFVPALTEMVQTRAGRK